MAEVGSGTIQYYRGAYWLLVFYHNSVGGVYFNSLNEAKKCDLPNRFSILSDLNQNYYFNNKFEFLLQYPGISDHNWWRQSYNPIEISEGTGDVYGYEPIEIAWKGHNWGGLAVSATGLTLLDGSRRTGYWWYSIGCVSSAYTPLIPGPYENETYNFMVSEVKLWVRINAQTRSKSRIGVTNLLIPLFWALL